MQTAPRWVANLAKVMGALVWFLACCIIGILCLAVASRFREKSNKLMWDLRERDIGTGQVPRPAGALAPDGEEAHPRPRIGPPNQ